MRPRPCISSTLVAVAMTYAPGVAQAQQRSDDNAVTQAEDAFGFAVGRESLGIYNAGNTRGFSPTAAGNVRIDGLYFDPVFGLPSTLVNNVSINARLRLLRLIDAHVLIEKFELPRIATLGNQSKSGFGKSSNPHHRHLLHVCAVLSRRLQTHQSKLRRHILCRNVSTALASPTTFEQIVRQKTHMLTNAQWINFLHGIDRRTRKVGIRRLGWSFLGC